MTYNTLILAAGALAATSNAVRVKGVLLGKIPTNPATVFLEDPFEITDDMDQGAKEAAQRYNDIQGTAEGNMAAGIMGVWNWLEGDFADWWRNDFVDFWEDDFVDFWENDFVDFWEDDVGGFFEDIGDFFEDLF